MVQPSRDSTFSRLQSRSLTSATLATSALALTGMLTGLLRDVLIARWFGATAIVDAFLVALILPTLIENFLGLALKDALIPILSDIQTHQGNTALVKTASGINGWVSLVAVGLGGLAFALADKAVALLAPGLTSWTAGMAVQGLRIASVTILLTALVHLTSSLLQLRRYFSVVAGRSVPLNLGIILGGGLLGLAFQPRGLLLGMVAGILFQVGMHWLVLRADGLPLGWLGQVSRDLFARLFKLLAPILVVTLALQINVIAERNLASSLPTGSIAILFYAYRLVMLPVNVIAEPLAAAIFPALAEYFAQGLADRVTEMLSRALRVIVFVMMPVTIGILILREPLVVLALRRGAFDTLAARSTALALGAYGVGLLGYAGSPILLRFFYASKQAYWPAVIGLGASGLYVVLALALVGPFAQAGLALAMGLTGLANFLGLLCVYGLQNARWIARPVWIGLGQHFGRVLLAGIVMGGALLGAEWLFPARLDNFYHVLAITGLKAGGGACLFVGVSALLGVTEARTVARLGFLRRSLHPFDP